MWKEHKKTLILASVVTLLPILAGVYLWDRLPETMATHFGIDNAANGFCSKPVAVFGLPLFLLAVEWIAAIATSHDPRRQNISPKMFLIMLWIAPVISVIGAAAIYSFNLGNGVDFSMFVPLLLGVLFIVIGNYMPKSRQNYTIGIKLPWTLANVENWNRTHRLGGYLWVIGGIVLVVLALAGVGNPIWLLPVLAVMVLVPVVYSYWLHVKRGL